MYLEINREGELELSSRYIKYLRYQSSTNQSSVSSTVHVFNYKYMCLVELQYTLSVHFYQIRLPRILT